MLPNATEKSHWGSPKGPPLAPPPPAGISNASLLSFPQGDVVGIGGRLHSGPSFPLSEVRGALTKHTQFVSIWDQAEIGQESGDRQRLSSVSPCLHYLHHHEWPCSPHCCSQLLYLLEPEKLEEEGEEGRKGLLFFHAIAWQKKDIVPAAEEMHCQLLIIKDFIADKR